MANVNLLPPDLGPKASVLRISVLLKKLVTVALFVFCFFSVLTIGYIYFLNFQVKKSNLNQEALKTSIKSLEQTEQKLFLIKDRLAKIKNLLVLETTVKEVENANQILIDSGFGVELTGVEVFPGKVSLTGNVNSSVVLGDFMDKLLHNYSYKTLKLTAFSYNPKLGYSFGFDILTK